jgi:hypothetical protein
LILAKTQALYKKLLSWCEQFWKKVKDLIGQPASIKAVEELVKHGGVKKILIGVTMDSIKPSPLHIQMAEKSHWRERNQPIM